MNLTKRQWSVLRRTAWGTEEFGALLTGRQTQVEVMRQLLALGLVADAGMVVVCDGDGFTLHPERYRQGWKITDAGKAMLADGEPNP